MTSVLFCCSYEQRFVFLHIPECCPHGCRALRALPVLPRGCAPASIFVGAVSPQDLRGLLLLSPLALSLDAWWPES